jgi:hypothetical protein
MSSPFHTVGTATTISTAHVPGGAPEEELKDAKHHNIGHFQASRNMIDCDETRAPGRTDSWSA